VASPRTGGSSGEERLPRWEAGAPAAAPSRSVNRGSNTTVAQRKARAQQRGSAPPPRDGSDNSGTPEIVRNVLGIVWIVFAAVITLLSLGFLIGSFAMVDVLGDISKARNFGTALGRKDHYDEYFDSLAAAGFKVVEDKPNIVKGVTNYLWTVVPPGTDALRVFSWQHSLETNELQPSSNAALLLDIELGYISTGDAPSFAVDFKYNPDDNVILAMLDRNVSYFAKGNPNGWGAAPAGPPAPLPPKFDPKKGRRSVGGAIESEEPEDEDAEGEEGEAVEGEPTEGEAGEAGAGESGEEAPPAETGDGDESEPPIEVVDPDEPPADDGGDEEPAPEPEPEDDGDGGDATDVR
jgi:hypothetical protein